MSNAITRWFEKSQFNPFQEISQIEGAMARLSNEIMSLKKKNGLHNFDFQPSCELAEENNHYVMKFDLPGILKDQVKVEVNNDQITVTAERKEEKKQEDKKTFVSEISYGSYMRSFSLPGPVDEKQVDAKFDNGVLTVTVPKTENSSSKRVPVQ